MVKKVKYTQLKAKKNWLLHTTSDRKKFKRKSRVSCCKTSARGTTVSGLHIEPSQKRSFLSLFLDISLLSRHENEPLGQNEVCNSNQAQKWRLFRLDSLNLVNIPGVHMASNAVLSGAHRVRYCVEKTRDGINVVKDSFNEGMKMSFRGIEFCKEVCR